MARTQLFLDRFVPDAHFVVLKTLRSSGRDLPPGTPISSGAGVPVRRLRQLYEQRYIGYEGGVAPPKPVKRSPDYDGILAQAERNHAERVAREKPRQIAEQSEAVDLRPRPSPQPVEVPAVAQERAAPPVAPADTQPALALEPVATQAAQTQEAAPTYGAADMGLSQPAPRVETKADVVGRMAAANKAERLKAKKDADKKRAKKS